MKLLGVTLASLGLASAATVAKKVNYDDWKVFRVNVGSEATKLQDVMSKLQLQLWKGKPESSDVVDLMVPPTAVKDFEASTQNFETKVMHDNLGLSIAEEESFSVYAGTVSPHTQRRCGANPIRQLVLRQTRHGSTRTIPLPITCNGSQTLRLRIPKTQRSFLQASLSKAAISRVSTSGVAAARDPKRVWSGTVQCTHVNGSRQW
jgi:hypothetical protein